MRCIVAEVLSRDRQEIPMFIPVYVYIVLHTFCCTAVGCKMLCRGHLLFCYMELWIYLQGTHFVGDGFCEKNDLRNHRTPN